MAVTLGAFSLDRMVNAVEKVRQRLLRAAAALEGARVLYAIAGGNAVALWVSRVDEAAVRNTQDVDILLRREDLPAARTALEAAGFVYRHTAGVDVFLDGPDAKARDGVHVVFANELVREGEAAANPDVAASESTGAFRVLALEALVQIKLTAFRRKDQVHLLDMIEVGIIDGSWVTKYPPALGVRLQSLLDDPNG
ncbi:MAG: hypothetical protein JWN40_3309 [Phycisphaerales bacterium]|nr:hypothetical protein [Phycisphaerales bacterium]